MTFGNSSTPHRRIRTAENNNIFVENQISLWKNSTTDAERIYGAEIKVCCKKTYEPYSKKVEMRPIECGHWIRVVHFRTFLLQSDPDVYRDSEDVCFFLLPASLSSSAYSTAGRCDTRQPSTLRAAPPCVQ